MLEDLLEFRRKLDRLIDKYKKEAIVRGDFISEEYRFEHDPRIVEDIRDRDTYQQSLEIEGDERLKDIGQELLKLKQKDKDDRSDEAPYKWEGNDIY